LFPLVFVGVVMNWVELLKMVLTNQPELLAYFCPRGYYQMGETKIKPFKLRHPVVVGDRPIGIIISWRMCLMFCTIVVFIVAGIGGWFYPWVRLVGAYIVIVMLISWTLLFLYRSHPR
jgi:hypothetical protein